SFLTSTAVHLGGPSPSLAVSTDHQQQQPQIEHQSAQQPPSASTVEIPRLGEPQSFTVPPSRFWNSEFRNKQPAFVRFNISLPWGANFAVYGRRNVAPSITQYDFAEFVKGGRVDHRLRRSVLAAPVTLPSQSARGTKTYDFETQTSQVRSRRRLPRFVFQPWQIRGWRLPLRRRLERSGMRRSGSGLPRRLFRSRKLRRRLLRMPAWLDRTCLQSRSVKLLFFK
ncbi:unnamed protein product, partial [Nesidiocoris tenuis]